MWREHATWRHRRRATRAPAQATLSLPPAQTRGKSSPTVLHPSRSCTVVYIRFLWLFSARSECRLVSLTPAVAPKRMFFHGCNASSSEAVESCFRCVRIYLHMYIACCKEALLSLCDGRITIFDLKFVGFLWKLVILQSSLKFTKFVIYGWTGLNITKGE